MDLRYSGDWTVLLLTSHCHFSNSMFPLGSRVDGINLSATRPAVICFPEPTACSCSYNLIGVISLACNKISISLSSVRGTQICAGQ